MTQVFLVSPLNTNATWPDPGNWNPTNKIEIVSAGSSGTAPNYNTPPGWSGFGGGGGGYGVVNNDTVSFPANYYVGQAGYPTQFNTGVGSTTRPTSGPGVWVASASFGTNGQVTTGGPAGYPSGFAGGSGGANGTANVGSGGGGAAGPHGAGSDGGSSPAYAGGAADGGTVAGPTASGGNGNSGTQFDATHGCGAGGAGGATTGVNGGIGGAYGGGGGGGGGNSSPGGNGGSPGQAIIIITYTPLAKPPFVRAAMMT